MRPVDVNVLGVPSKRLMTIISVLEMGWEKVEREGLALAVARYLFSWPNLLPTFFLEMLKKEDRRVLVLMLYYFATVSRLPGERYWWMKERAVNMYGRVLESLGDSCAECRSYGVAIFEVRDLG